MMCLLDTCVISEATKPNPSAKILEWLAAQEEMGLYLSVLTMGEIHKGIATLRDSRKRRRLSNWVQGDLSRRFSGRM